MISAGTAGSAVTAEDAGESGPLGVPFAWVVLLSLALCAVVCVLPDAGVLMPAKLVAATYATLVLPGAVILRLFGWPRSLAAALPACATWSLTALAPGFVLMLLTDGGMIVAVLWLLLVVGVGLLIGRGKPVEMDLRPTPLSLWFIAGVVLFAALTWLGSWVNVGDAVEHIARIRKISELDPPRSLDELGLLPPDTGLHPGYAFPLWHAAGALEAWITGLEETYLFRFWPSMLVPFAACAVYSAGRSMFGSRAAGLVTCGAFLGVFAFPAGGDGYFKLLDYPGNVCIFLLWPLVIDRTFTYLREGGREPILTVAATSFAVSAIHASYAPFMIMLIGVFLVVRTVIARDRGELRRLAVMLAAVTVPFLLFLIWLFPIADSASSTVARGRAHFATLVDTHGGLVNMKSEWLTRGGPAAIVALLLVPLASAAVRTRAAAFIGGTSAFIILLLITPWFFTPFAEVESISQGRRLIFYLPFAFALTGGALILARFRYAAVAGALVVSTLLHLRWPGDFGYELSEPGPGWVAWLSALGAVAVLAVGAAGKLNLRFGNGWALPIMIAFLLPLAVTGIKDMAVLAPERRAGLDQNLVAAVDKYVSRDDLLLGPTKAAYRLSSLAPVYIAAVAGGHGGDTVQNMSKERRHDAAAFFSPGTSQAELEDIVRRWHVQWVLVRKDQPYPREFLSRFPPVYDGAVFALYPVDPAVVERINAANNGSGSS
jgi:hypothetical protein